MESVLSIWYFKWTKWTRWKVMNEHFNNNSDMKFTLVVFIYSSKVKSKIYSTRKYQNVHVRYARTWNYHLTLTTLLKSIHETFIQKLAWWENEDFTPDKILNVDGFNGKKDVKFFKWCRENKNIGKTEAALKCDTAIKT